MIEHSLLSLQLNKFTSDAFFLLLFLDNAIVVVWNLNPKCRRLKH